MSYLFKSATIITLGPPTVERGDIRVDRGIVVDRGGALEAQPDDEIINLNGKLVMPGMVNSHTHLYSALSRGMPAPARTPANFKEILELIWWRLDRALDEETLYWSAMAGAMDAARAGTTCLFDHHASPSHIGGSLQIVREAIEKVGLRAVLCYEVTDRGGDRERDHGVGENRAFLRWARHSTEHASLTTPSRFRAMVGAHASFTLSDESLDACSAVMREFDTGLHIHVAEDNYDVEHTRSRYGLGVVERLAKHGALNSRSILAHGIHLSDTDIETARAAGVWFAHNPRSNMNNRVGYAPVAKFGDRVVLGTDGIGADMFEESHFAFFKGRDLGARASRPLDAQTDEDMRAGRSGSQATEVPGADDWIRVLANNQRLASEAFASDLHSLATGAIADLIVLDYQSPTPLSADNLAWHLMFGMNSSPVESVMVSGKFVIQNRRATLDDELYEHARNASEKLWARLRESL